MAITQIFGSIQLPFTNRGMWLLAPQRNGHRPSSPKGKCDALLVRSWEKGLWGFRRWLKTMGYTRGLTSGRMGYSHVENYGVYIYINMYILYYIILYDIILYFYYIILYIYMCPTWSLWVWLNMFWNTGWCVHTFLHVDLTRATNPRITKDFRMNHSLVTWVGGESTFSHDFSNPLFPTFQPLKCDFLSKSTVQNQILNGFWAEFLRKPEFCGAYPWCC